VKTVQRWFSDRLQDEITVVRWGISGRPVLVFPSAGGDAEEIERFGLVGACGQLLAEGRIKLYSVDSVAGQAMVTKSGSIEHRTWLLARIKEKDFTLLGLVGELAERGLKVDYRSVWTFVHDEKLSFKKSRGGQRTRSPRRRAPAGAVEQVSRPHRA